MDDASSIVLRSDACIILFSMNTEFQPHPDLDINARHTLHTRSSGPRSELSFGFRGDIVSEMGIRQTRCYGFWLIVMTRRSGGCIRHRLPIGIVLDQSDSVHLIFHSNFIKSQDWAERRPAAPSGASQNWNLKLTRFIEMETSNIKELSLNFIDKLRLFWSVSKVSVLLRAFAVQIGISFDCTKRKFQGLKWKYCKWKWHQSSRHSAHSLWKQAWFEFKSCD